MTTATVVVSLVCVLASVGAVWAWPILTDPTTAVEAATFKSKQRVGHFNNESACSRDGRCAPGLFCDRHYRRCLPYRDEGQPCRRDYQCRRHECVFGRCRRRIRKGERGARCRRDGDCGPSMCCARHHGERVCQSRLPLDHRCYVPSGGLDYTINELCPCDEGLHCGGGGGRPKSSDLTPSWIESDAVFRCVPTQAYV